MGRFNSRVMKTGRKVCELQKLKQRSVEIIQKAAQKNKTVEKTSGDKDTRRDVMRRCAVSLSGVLEGPQDENEARNNWHVLQETVAGFFTFS